MSESNPPPGYWNILTVVMLGLIPGFIGGIAVLKGSGGSLPWLLGIGVTALIYTLICGYGLHKAARSQASVPAKQSAFAVGQAGAPFIFGVVMAMMVLWRAGDTLLAGDRFYTSAAATRIVWALPFSMALFVVAAWLPSRRSARVARNGLRWESAAAFGLEVLAAILIVAAGVRFGVIGFWGATSVDLGSWSAALTVLWIVTASWAVRLLDGLDGAAPILLLTAAVAVFAGAFGNSEFLLSALCLITAGAAAGSLRFHLFPARLPLRGAATGAFGFVFAVLTVMARQKTVAVLLLIFPLALMLLLLGGAMLGLLERTLLLPGSSKDSDNEGEGDSDSKP